MTRMGICQEHCNSLGINDEEGLKAYLRELFEKHDHQGDVLIDIYKMVFPDWDKIEKIDGHPEAGKSFWQFICRQFITFDEKHHPNVFKGGLWMSSGFSSNGHLSPWELSFEACTVSMS